MKVNRTFSVDLWIVEKLESRVNKSQTVCDALKQFLDKEVVDDEENITKNLLQIVEFALFECETAVDTAQVHQARDILLAFIQEYFQDSA